jgi:hypothetical protein
MNYNLYESQNGALQKFAGDVGPLSSRMIPINFNGDPLTKEMRFRIKGNTDASFKYKVYLQGETGCSGVSDGPRNFLQLNSSMKLYVLMSNTDLVKSTTFTVILESPTNPIRVSGAPGQTIESKITLPNLGSVSTNLNYTVYPIGVHADASDPSLALMPRRVRNPIAATSISRPQNSVFDNVLYSSRSGQLNPIGVSTLSISSTYSGLRAANAPSVTPGPGSLQIPVRVVCSGAGGRSHEDIDVVYETGLTDDRDTPDFEGDDTRELEVITVPIWADCGNPIKGISTTENYGRNLAVFATSNGGLMAWGQLGAYNDVFSHYDIRGYNVFSAPAVIPGISQVADANGTFFAKTDGSLWSYGPYFTSYQFYDQNAPSCRGWTEPKLVSGISEVQKIIANKFIKFDGSVWQETNHGFADTPCFYYSTSTFTKMSGLENIVDLFDQFAVNADGKVLVIQPNGSVTEVKALENIVKVQLYLYSTGYEGIALKVDGTLLKVFIPDDVAVEAQTEPIVNLKDVVDIFGSGGSHFAIDKNGALLGWGQNSYGVLGLGHNIPVDVPTVVSGIDQVTAFSGNYAVTKSGSVFFWGGVLRAYPDI